MRLAATLLLAGAGCAAALREPPPIPALGQGGRPVGELLAEAEASYARRPDREAVRRAEVLFAEAAAADRTGTEGLVGSIRAKVWLVEHERDGALRETLALQAVQAGQWCARRAPGSPACDYWLALGLGQQARERPATASDGLKLMAEALRRAAAGDPRLDLAGPHRVLAMLLLRAPAWPLGPGDSEEGLAEARRAVALFPAHPPNRLALAEALLANDQRDEGRAEASQALGAARQLAAAGDPDAPDWARDAERLLAR